MEQLARGSLLTGTAAAFGPDAGAGATVAPAAPGTSVLP